VTVAADPLARVGALPGVAEAADSARQAVDRLLRHRLLRRRSAELSGEAALRSARASAALAGVDIPLDALRRDGSPDPVVQGALRVAAEMGALRETFGRAPLQVLARLHVLAAADLAPAPELGRRREEGEQADGPAPSPLEVSARLDGLVRVLGITSRAPAIVTAAVLHAELLALRPFGTANGVVARGAARLLLVSRGLDPKALTVPDVGHLELAEEYQAAHEAYLHGTAVGAADGVARWVRHCCQALELGARETLAVCEALQRS